MRFGGYDLHLGAMLTGFNFLIFVRQILITLKYLYLNTNIVIIIIKSLMVLEQIKL